MFERQRCPMIKSDSLYKQDLNTAASLADHYSKDSDSKWCPRHKVAAASFLYSGRKFWHILLFFF